MALSAQLLR